MNQFFYALTKRNWGWPYHIILAEVLAIPLLIMWNWLWSAASLGQTMVITWFCVILVGYIYETIQIKRDPKAKDEFWEDMIGNCIGVILACIKFWAILKVVA